MWWPYRVILPGISYFSLSPFDNVNREWTNVPFTLCSSAFFSGTHPTTPDKLTWAVNSLSNSRAWDAFTLAYLSGQKCRAASAATTALSLTSLCPSVASPCWSWFWSTDSKEVTQAFLKSIPPSLPYHPLSTLFQPTLLAYSNYNSSHSLYYKCLESLHCTRK